MTGEKRAFGKKIFVIHWGYNKIYMRLSLNDTSKRKYAVTLLANIKATYKYNTAIILLLRQ